MHLNLKKVSVFVDGRLRQRLGENGNDLLAKAFGQAVLFPALLVQILSTGFHEPEELPQGLRAMYKYFHGSSGESDRLYGEFKQTVRLEAVLTTWTQSVVHVDISFFSKGVKEASYELRLGVDFDGKVAGITEIMNTVNQHRP